MEKEEILSKWLKDTTMSGHDSVIKAMEEYAEQKSIDFVRWIANHPLDFQTTADGAWIGVDMKTYSSTELFELYKQ